jgi:hypothetical protein
MSAAQSDAIVFCGATGDLAYNQIFRRCTHSRNTIGSTSP